MSWVNVCKRVESMKSLISLKVVKRKKLMRTMIPVWIQLNYWVTCGIEWTKALTKQKTQKDFPFFFSKTKR